MNESAPIGTFFAALRAILDRIEEREGENFERAAELIAYCISRESEGALFHVWGPGGHSSIIAEETLYRKGGLASVNPILDAGISLSHGALKEINGLERTRGYASAVLEYHRVGKGDVILLGSAYGVNVVTIEAAIEAHARGAKVIAITSSEFSRSVKREHPGRHETQKNLYEVADVAIDSYVPPGDAVVQVNGFSQKVAPVATIVQSAVYQALVAQVVAKLTEMGIQAKIWTNALDLGGIEANKNYISQYYGRAKSL